MVFPSLHKFSCPWVKYWEQVASAHAGGGCFRQDLLGLASKCPWELQVRPAEGWSGKREGRRVLGKGVYLCYIVIWYISEFSMEFCLKKPIKNRNKI